MNRDFLKNAGVPDEAIDKIMAEWGRDLQAEKDKSKAASAELETYRTKVADLEKSAGESESVRKELEDLKAKIAEEKRIADEKAADEELTATIRKAIPQDRKFVNAYTESAMIAQIKAEMGKAENKGKGVSELFEALTKDKTDLFANPNQLNPNMAGFGGADKNDLDDARVRRVMGLPVKS